MTAIRTDASFSGSVGALNVDYLNVDPIATSERKALLRELWNVINPELELQYGIYNSTVAAPSAIFSQALINSLDRWRSHTQISSLVTNQADIDAGYLDLFLANYRVLRQTGNYSTGLVRLRFSENTSYAFNGDDTFTAKGTIFAPTTQFGIKPVDSPTAIPPYSAALQALDDGTFSAIIEVQSTTISVTANLPVGTILYPTGSMYSELIEAVVIESFVGGVPQDTTETLVTKMINGITSPVLTSRANIEAQLKSLEGINISDISVIGAGDIESIRDKHGLFGISMGGRGDIYVRTNPTLLNRTITKTCERITIVDDNTARFRCNILVGEAPAAYSITAVNSEVSSKSLPIKYETRSVDLTSKKYSPDVINYVEGAFTAFQTITFEFEDNGMKRFGDDFNLWPATVDYSVSYDYLPNIVELQDYVSSRANVAVMGDLLVKSALPCKVNIAFSVAVQESQTQPDVNVLISAVVNTVSNTGFMNVLPASIIIEAVQRLLPSGMFVSDFTMTGDLTLPIIQEDAGAVTVLRHTAESAKEELYFEHLPYATANTIAFFTDSNSVNITIKNYKSVARLMS